MKNRTKWFEKSRWGVMTHFLAAPPSTSLGGDISPDEWNRIVDSFNVEAFCGQIAETGAGYLIFTLGQNSGHFCSPNSTYDSLTGISPSKCSRRDLVADVAEAMAKRGISLIAYCPSHAPAAEMQAVESLKCTPPWDLRGSWGGMKGYKISPDIDDRLTVFQQHWEKIVSEWGDRWKDLIKGWWIDGCYFADKMYRHDDEPNFASFAKALRTGCPDRIVAFNDGHSYCGAAVCSMTDEEDFTAGELFTALPAASPDKSLKAFYHTLCPLGLTWNNPVPRFPDSLPAAYTQLVNSWGGVMTWDVAISQTGTIQPEIRKQLLKMKTQLARCDV